MAPTSRPAALPAHSSRREPRTALPQQAMVAWSRQHLPWRPFFAHPNVFCTAALRSVCGVCAFYLTRDVLRELQTTRTTWNGANAGCAAQKE
jgi:hypothetical protein